MEMMQQSLEGRGEDKRRRNYRTMQGGAVGALAGGVGVPAAVIGAGALNDVLGDGDLTADIMEHGYRGLTTGRTLARGAVGGLLLGGLAGLRSEANRQKAKKMSKNPTSVMAELEKTRRRRRVRSEAKTLARVQAARQGRKVQGNPLVRIDRADGGR
jgi:hypothetical protein